MAALFLSLSVFSPDFLSLPRGLPPESPALAAVRLESSVETFALEAPGSNPALTWL